MRRVIVAVCLAALTLSLTTGVAAAAPTNARNYEELPATCDHLGEIVIALVSMGQWGTGKVVGTRLTLIPRSIAFTATNLDTGEQVFADEFAKRNARIDDRCTFTFIDEVPEGDPEFEPGTYLLEGVVGVKVVGRR